MELLWGHLDNNVGPQVASAIDRGVSFTVAIKTAHQNYDDRFKPTTGSIRLKIEYQLEKNQPAIEVPKAAMRANAKRPPRRFFTKIAGVTFEGRQQIIARCSAGEKLRLVRDPSNPFDKGAIKVVRLNGEQLGFIPAHVSRGGDSSGLAFQLDRGHEYQCRIKDVTGGGAGLSLGVNIEITEGEELDGIALSPSKIPDASSVRAVNRNLGRLFAAVAVLLLLVIIVLIVMHNV